MSKEVITTILKIIVAVCTAILGVLGVYSVTACTVAHNLDSVGRAVIITNDTTVINHGGVIKFPKD